MNYESDLQIIISLHIHNNITSWHLLHWYYLVVVIHEYTQNQKREDWDQQKRSSGGWLQDTTFQTIEKMQYYERTIFISNMQENEKKTVFLWV